MNLTYLLQVLLAGVETSLTPKAQPKYDLRKQKTLTEKLNDLFQRNFYIIAVLAIAICVIMFVVVCFYVCGVSAVESGTYYNHFKGVI